MTQNAAFGGGNFICNLGGGEGALSDIDPPLDNTYQLVHMQV